MPIDQALEHPSIVELNQRSLSEKSKDFSELLDTIQNVDSKLKSLWKNIYDNAVTDRQNSFVMFATLVAIVGASSSEFAVHGRTITSYLERMQKATDQMLRLSEAIANATPKEEGPSANDLFDRIRDQH